MVVCNECIKNVLNRIFLEGVARFGEPPQIYWDAIHALEQLDKTCLTINSTSDPNSPIGWRRNNYPILVVGKKNNKLKFSYTKKELNSGKILITVEEVADVYGNILTENNNNNIKNMKQVIRLTESDLHRMIKESIKRVLKKNKNNIEGVEDIWDLEGDSHKSFKNKYGFTDHSDIPSQFYQFKDVDEPNSYYSGENVPYSHRDIGDVDKEKEASWKDFDYVKSQLNKARNRYLDKEYEKRTSYTRPRAENEFLPSELDDYLNSYRSPNNYTNTPNLKGYADDFKDELDKKWKSQQERDKYEKMADSRPLHRKGSLNREL